MNLSLFGQKTVTFSDQFYVLHQENLVACLTELDKPIDQRRMKPAADH